MKNEDNIDSAPLKRFLFPMLAMAFAYFVANLIKGEFNGVGAGNRAYDLYIIGAHVISQVILQVFAFITCWAFVLRKKKSDGHIWIDV